MPGTRSFHHFESDGIEKMKFKRVSNDSSFCKIHTFLCKESSLNAADIPLMSYICCVYDSNWWMGLVVEIDFLKNDIRINFLHPHGPYKYFLLAFARRSLLGAFVPGVVQNQATTIGLHCYNWFPLFTPQA